MFDGNGKKERIRTKMTGMDLQLAQVNQDIGDVQWGTKQRDQMQTGVATGRSAITVTIYLGCG